MPYIKVNTNKFSSYKTELETARKFLCNARTSILNIQSSLDWDIRYSNDIDARLELIKSDFYPEATSISNMQEYLDIAKIVYDEQEQAVINNTDNPYIAKSTAPIVIGKESGTYWGKEIEHQDVIDTGKLVIDGVKIISKLKNPPTSVNVTKGSFVIPALINGGKAGINIIKSWTDENKTTEKKICDTIANATCAAAATCISVAGKVANKAIITAATAAIPIPIVGTLVGVAAGYVAEKLIGVVANTMMSEAVVNQVSDSIENVVGAAKAGCKAVSDKAKEVADAKGLAKVGKAAELVGTAVVETAKVAATAVIENTKIAVTATVEAVKNVGKSVVKSVKKLFKGW